MRGPLAQRVERRAFNPGVGGSSPSGPTRPAPSAALEPPTLRISVLLLFCNPLRVLDHLGHSAHGLILHPSQDVCVDRQGKRWRRMSEAFLYESFRLVVAA